MSQLSCAPTRRLVIAGATFLATAHAALAHAVLVQSTPADGATVPTGPTQIRLRFNSLIDAERSWLVLVLGKQETKLRIRAGETADTLLVTVDVPSGPCVLRWQVLAKDGHITRGQLTFRGRPGPGER